MSRVRLGLLLIVATALSYYNSFPGAFHYDDFPLLLENPIVTGSDFDYLSFLHQYGGRPLTFWSFHINHRLAGDSVFAFHFTNVILHGLVVWLLFMLVTRWSGRTAVGFLTAALFAVHPAQMHAVNYIWSRSILLMSVFVLLALLTKRPWLRLVLFQLAIWGRAEALVAVAPLIWKEPRRWKGIVVLASVNLAAFLTGFLLEDPAAMGWNHPDAPVFWLTSSQAFWKYVLLALAPLESSIYHSAPGLGWKTILALASLTALGAFIGVMRKKWPQLAIGMGWFALFLAPGLLIPNTAQFSESRIYLALAGICFLVACGFSKFHSEQMPELAEDGARSPDPDRSEKYWPRTLPQWGGTRYLPLFVLVVALATTTYSRNSIWLNDVALWEEAVESNPMDFIPHYNLAAAQVRQGRNLEAEEEFRLARTLNQSDDMAYAGLGYCAELREAWPEAIGYYKSAQLINPANLYAIESLKRVRAIMERERSDP